MGVDRNHLSDRRWDIYDFGQFFSIFGQVWPISALIVQNSLKPVYNHVPMYVIGVFSHSYPI